jgi:peroxiredoxin
MKKKLSYLAVGLISASVALAAPEIGKPAPDFTLTDAEGTSHSLADFKGKTVVLEWFNYGCPFVVKHYESGNMQKLQEAAVSGDAVWLTIVSSAQGKQGHLIPDEAKAKTAELGSNATAMLLDEDGKVGQLYDAKMTPEMYVINAEGTLVYQGAIDDKADTKTASIDGATNYVTAALDSLVAGEEIETPKTKAYGCSVKY